jgi:hypothetical protein
MALERELATYRRLLPELRQHEGTFALIQGDDFIDTFSTYEDAIRQGYAKFGLQPFLVKQIQALGKVQFVSRLVDPMSSGSR